MKKYHYLSAGLFLFCLLSGLSLTAQVKQTKHLVWGRVQDSTGRGLAGATITIRSEVGDSALAVADSAGLFYFREVRGNKATLTFSSIGFQSLKRHYILDTARVTGLEAVVLQQEANVLNSVTVTGVIPMTIKEDTVEYNVAAYKVRNNAPIEDVIRKLPGVDVDADGNITAQGKQVTKARVNGKDFFGGDVKTATRNLPADLVESIQIIDDYGDQANLTGVKTGEPDRILNITIRKDKSHGYTVQGTVGEGTDLLPKNPGVSNSNRYVAQLNALSFSGDQQMALLGNLNNTNASTFAFGAVPGMTSPSGGTKSSGNILGTIAATKAAAAGGAGGNGSTATGPDQNGITVTRSVGANYRDQWGKNVSVYGSYSFGDNTIYNKSYILQQNTTPANSGTTIQTTTETDNTINHRFTWNIEYKPDDVNYLKVTPVLSYQSIIPDALASSVSTRDNAVNQAYSSTYHGHASEPSEGLTALYNYHFRRGGNNLSFNFTVTNSTGNQFQNPVYDYTDGTPTAPVNQLITTNTRTTNYNATVSYLQPLANNRYLEFIYAYNSTVNTFGKNTYTTDSLGQPDFDSTLSASYNYTFVRHRGGVNYRVVRKNKYNYTIGVSLEPSVLEGNYAVKGGATHVNQVNFIPSARLVYTFAKNKTLTVNYNGSSSQPTFAQVQPVIDFSNALYPVQGNPDLKQQFTSRLSVNYNQFDIASGNSLFSNIAVSGIQNKVVTNVISYPVKYPLNPSLQGTYLTQYLNADGYYTVSGSVNFAKPWDRKKYTLIVSAQGSYTNNVGYVSSIDSASFAETTNKNVARTLVLKPGVRLRVDLGELMDGQIQADYAINRTDNSIHNAFTDATANFRTLTLGINGKNYFKDWTLSYDYSKAFYYGYSLPVSPLNILNAYIERRFLQQGKATIRLAVYDLFNQNTGYSVTSSPSFVSQTTNMRLGRYLMATFTLRLQKFSGKPSTKG